MSCCHGTHKSSSNWPDRTLTDYPRIGLIAWGQGVKVLGCEKHSGWCEIVADGQRGWVPGAKLTWPSILRKPIDASTSRRVTI